MRNQVSTFVSVLIGTALMFASLSAFAAERLPPRWNPNECGGIGPDLKPIMDTHKFAPYPVASQRLGVQGTTELKVLIDKDGNASEVAVIMSSGSTDLDETSIAAVKGKWRWEPLPPECRDTGVTTHVSFNWTLSNDPKHLRIVFDDPRYPAAARESKLRGFGAVVVKISEASELLDVSIASSTGSAVLDDAMLRAVRGMQFFPQKLNGHPQPTSIVVPVDFLPDIKRFPDGSTSVTSLGAAQADGASPAP